MKYIIKIEEQLKLIEKKFPEGEVIAYFQNFTNTYADVNYLREIYTRALSHPRVLDWLLLLDQIV